MTDADPPRPAGRLIRRRSTPADAPTSTSDAPTIVADLAPPAADAPLPTAIGPYRVLGELARGGMGVILRAHHAGLDRPVAIKLLRAVDDPDARARFLLEARAAARLSRHPSIVPVHDVGTCAAGRDFLVMDLVDGPSLHAVIAREGALGARAAATLVAKVARAVAHAHRNGVLHRDLKPHNVLVERATGEPLLTDFGLAKLVRAGAPGPDSARRRVGVSAATPGQGLTLEGEVLGTPAYMAPEQLEPGAAPGPHTDVWGLGAILHECLSGQPPFAGDTLFELFEQVLHHPPRSLAGVPPALAAVAERCLQKDPRARYGSAEEVARDLERFVDGAPVLAQVLVRRRGGGVARPGRAVAAAALAALAAYLVTTRAWPALAPLVEPALAPVLAPSAPPPAAPLDPGRAGG
ncbi:MAG: serine/threonine protein kinase [Planctomycetes bacterium]|nr:serine/threonine protein kinase [Planctomycetota bacterium]